MNMQLIQHRTSRQFLQCQYKKKYLPIGFLDSHLADNVTKRIASNHHKTNVRLKTRNITPFKSEEYMFEDEIYEKLRCFSRDINSSIIVDRETKNAHDEHPWKITDVHEKEFYSYPLNPKYNGIAICFDVDERYNNDLGTKNYDFNRKIIALKAIVIMFDTPTIGQLNRLFRNK